MGQVIVPDDILDEVRALKEKANRLELEIRDLQSYHGHIASDGSVHHGNGSFSSQKLAVGDYRVTFDNDFDEAPIVQLTIADGVVGDHLARVHPTEAPTVGGFRVLIYDSSAGTQVDSGFNFSATHP